MIKLREASVAALETEDRQAYSIGQIAQAIKRVCLP